MYKQGWRQLDRRKSNIYLQGRLLKDQLLMLMHRFVDPLPTFCWPAIRDDNK